MAGSVNLNQELHTKATLSLDQCISNLQAPLRPVMHRQPLPRPLEMPQDSPTLTPLAESLPQAVPHLLSPNLCRIPLNLMLTPTVCLEAGAIIE